MNWRRLGEVTANDCRTGSGGLVAHAAEAQGRRPSTPFLAECWAGAESLSSPPPVHARSINSDVVCSLIQPMLRRDDEASAATPAIGTVLDAPGLRVSNG